MGKFKSVRSKLISVILIASIIPAAIILMLFMNRLGVIREEVIKSSNQVILENIKRDMEHIARNQANYLQLKMDSFAKETRLIATSMETIYNRPGNWQPTMPKRKLLPYKGCYYGEYRTPDDGDLYISGNNRLTPEVLREVMIQDELTPILMQAAKQHNDIVYAYYVQNDSIVRGYPTTYKIWETVDIGILDPKSDFTQMPFYYVADPKHDPEREPRWTDIYFDPGGNGWMFSICMPVYSKNKIKGVVALDITTQQIANNVLDLDIGNSGYAMLLSKDGSIIGAPKAAYKDLAIKTNKFNEAQSASIRNHQSLLKLLKNTKTNDGFFKQVSIGSNERYVYIRSIKDSPFVLALVIPSNALLAYAQQADAKISAESLRMIDELIVAALAILAVSILAAIYFARRISTPIMLLTKSAKRVAAGDLYQSIFGYGSDEIAALAESFNQMITAIRARDEDQMALNEELRSQNDELDIKNHELMRLINQLNESEQAKEQFQVLSYKDSLTGLYNRRYLDEHFERDVEEKRDSNYVYACLMLDVDNFKQVNDTHGHLVGDAVLQYVAETLLNNKRLYDVVLRYAGDEFVVLLKDADEEEALRIAERIRSCVADGKCGVVGNIIPVTVSIGVALNNSRNKKQNQNLLQAADNALYEAKRSGCNRVVLSRDKFDAA